MISRVNRGYAVRSIEVTTHPRLQTMVNITTNDTEAIESRAAGDLLGRREASVPVLRPPCGLRGRFIPLFYPVISRLVWCVGSRQEMVFSPVRR
ncbi:hypothetical protein ACH4U5_39360, partial [Streptomyces sp. NPDC020858]|uniref:hypothetical protein n=1 Tax=Streptomyces sp. NPDC020858 TaxID=3365097 RepID=UPI003795B4DC